MGFPVRIHFESGQSSLFFMGKLKKYLSETENQLEGDDLRKLYILTCTHENHYGVDTYTSVHSTQVEALGYVENIKAN